MKNNKKIMLSLVLVAFIAVAAIGIGFAYQASTSNSGNTVTPGHMTVTLTDGSSHPAYSDRFDTSVMYNTLTTFEGGREFVTFTFDTEQMDVKIDGSDQFNAIEVGSVYLNIAYENAADPYVILMANDGTGVMSTKYTYKIGYSYGANEEAATDAYPAVPDTQVFDPVNGTKLAGPVGGFTNQGAVLVKLYVTGMEGSQKLPIDEVANLVKPLDNVTFKFTAITTTPKFNVTLPSFDRGTVEASVVSLEGLTAGTPVTFTVTPDTHCVLTAFSLNGVDYLADAGDGSVALTIGSSDVTVAATFKAELYELSVSMPNVTTEEIEATNPAVNGNQGCEVLIEYKLSIAEDSAYTTDKPSAVGAYTIRASVAETAIYLAKSVTCTFAITEP